MEMDIGTAIWRGRTAQNIAINVSGVLAGSALFTPDAGKRFAVHYLALQVTTTTSGVFSFQSGGTNITGAMTYSGTVPNQFAPSFEAHACGMPIMMGINNGDAWQITVSTAFDLDGWAIVSQLDGIAGA